VVLPADYLERVYAGVLGKVIGVYVGRPFEQWSQAAIEAKFGEIDRYVAEEAGHPLIVADDDITGTFTFLRALEDYGPNLTPDLVAKVWMNYLVEGRTVLWWGGMGTSTEHTAYLRLKHGVTAPESGSIALNGRIVAEQIGAQIFIDGWGLVCPGRPDLAVEYARIAASVSHDGEAIYGAQMVASMVSMAFHESDIDALVNHGLEHIPPDCLIREVVTSLRAWKEEGLDWRASFKRIEEQYGYAKYGGGCHIIPNHAVVILALLHCNGSFREGMRIANTVGYDTDCNSANVGCILGVRGGLAAFEGEGYDWRTPVADRVLMPTADGGDCITDCASLARRVANMGRQVAGLSIDPGPRMAFNLPGAMHGFGGGVSVSGGLRIDSEATSPVFLDATQFGAGGYGLSASPILNPGQVVRAEIDSTVATEVTLFVDAFGEEDCLRRIDLAELIVDGSGMVHGLVPEVGGFPIARLGLRTEAPVILRSLHWSGEPSLRLSVNKGKAWKKAWVDGVTEFNGWSGAFELIQNECTGLGIYGCREWKDIEVSASISPNMAKRFGVAVRVQGMKRYIALVLTTDQKLQLIREDHGTCVLAEAPFEWEVGQPYEFCFSANGSHFEGVVGTVRLSADDDVFASGAAAYVVEEGRIRSPYMQIEPT
jgi:ADP-ribosylglycohydrolase